MSISAVNVHRYGGFNSAADLGCEIKMKQTIREVGGGQNLTGKPQRHYIWKTKAIEKMEMKGFAGKRKIKMMSQRKCSLSFFLLQMALRYVLQISKEVQKSIHTAKNMP